MRLNLQDAERLARSGATALQQGRAAEARRDFEQVAASGLANIQIWLLLAHSCRMLDDAAGTEKAADEVLRLDPRNVRALILKGDCRHGAEDMRAASSYYIAALGAAGELASVPADLQAELTRVEGFSREIARGYRRRLETHLDGAGFGEGARSPRFEESLAILCEEKRVYFQKPSAYYFPRLPQIQFYEREAFPWAAAIEDAADDMRAELAAAIADDGLFTPYLKARENRPNNDFHGLLDNPDWSTLYLWENGGPVERNVARFPKTYAAVQQAPLPFITTRAPSILFSMLKAGARIQPHHGMINTRLICHLPLIVPEGCGFRVGNEVRQWEVGKLLIFDDTIEHEAWNDSGEDRVILIFDVWRPELTEAERSAVTAIFEAIDRA